MACPNSTDYMYLTRSCISVQSTGMWIDSNFTSCEPSTKPPIDQEQWLLIITYICASIAIVLLLVAVLVLISLRFLETSTVVVRCCLALSMIGTVIFFIITFQTEKHNTICRLAVVGFQYWVNSQFLWILLETMRLYIGATSLKNAVRTWVYHFTGWVLPLVLVLICAVLYFEEYAALVRCFKRWHIFLCFLGPVVVLIMIVLLFLTFLQTNEVLLMNRKSKFAKRPRGSLRNELGGTCILFVLLSSCWITALIAVRFDSQTLQQAFAILLLLEAITFVLIYIVFNEAVKNALQPQPAQPTVVEMKCETRNSRHCSDHFLTFNTSSTHNYSRTASTGRRFSQSDTIPSTNFGSHNRFGLNFRRNSVGSSTACTGDSSNTSTSVTTCDDSISTWQARYSGSVGSRPRGSGGGGGGGSGGVGGGSGGGGYTGSSATESLHGRNQSDNKRSSKISRRKSRNTVLEHKILQHVRLQETSSPRKRVSRRSKKRCPLPSDTSSSSSTNSLKILSTSLKLKPNPFNAAKVSPSIDESTVDAFQPSVTRRLSWSKTADDTQFIPQISLHGGGDGVLQCEQPLSAKPPIQPRLKPFAVSNADVNSTSRPTDAGNRVKQKQRTDSTIRISMLSPLEISPN
ncbi:uncharacterized protein LOC117112181 isoform X2 [Anneissia japonica]|nr:uncharacterized protein LOC117112181 isoform X2 [Anneissia japonica]